MGTTVTYLKRFRTETIILWDSETESFLKFEPGKPTLQKFPGKPENIIEDESKVITRAIFGRQERSKEQYESA